MAIKTFTSEVLTSGDVNTYLANSGLVYVTSTTIGTAVSSVTVSSAFSATYDRYKIIVSGTRFSAGSVAAYMNLTGVTGSPNYGSFTYQLATSATVYGSNVPTSTYFYIGLGGSNSCYFEIDGMDPNNTLGKSAVTKFSSYDSTASYGGSGALWSTSGTTSTGFSFLPSGGTITGGTITVYGYRKA